MEKNFEGFFSDVSKKVKIEEQRIFSRQDIFQKRGVK